MIIPDYTTCFVVFKIPNMNKYLSAHFLKQVTSKNDLNGLYYPFSRYNFLAAQA